MKIGMVTIGQSPRVDIIPNMKKIIGSGVQIIESGALDGLSIRDVERMAPESLDENILITRMRDGKPVTLDKEKVSKRIQESIYKVVKKGSQLVVLLCTGELPEFYANRILIRPDKLLMNLVRGILPKGKLGIVVPSRDQVSQVRKRWEDKGLDLVIYNAMPYVSSRKYEVISVANRLLKEDVDLILLDCIGFDTDLRDEVRRITNKPIILPSSILAYIIKSLIY